jgi:streptomycin 6-kinase
MAARGPAWAAHVDALPRTLRELTGEWGLAPEPGAELAHGHASVVVPVRRDGEAAVLKVAFPDDGSEHEALALQRWGGDGAVRLLAADPRRRALLLERLEPTDLGELWDVEACEVVAGLYARLHRPAPPQLRRLTDVLARSVPGLRALPRDAPLPHRLVEQALSLLEQLGDDDPGLMLHTDLHYAHVLAAEREPWLAIAPEPLAGDPHAELAPMLWHRWDELVGSWDGVRGAVRRRFHTLVDTAGLSEDRARDWVVVRAVLDAYRETREATPDRDWITRCVTLAKAVQD